MNNIYVPNVGPEDAKIMFIGESPGETEEHQKQPFVGDSGQILMQTLGRWGLSRDEVFLANLSHYRPPGNRFEYLVDTPQLAEGLRDINEYIERNRPTVIVPLGAQPLLYLTGRKSIHAWRGSILEYKGCKTIPTFHPSAVLRDRTLYPIFDADFSRIRYDSDFRELRLPERKFIIDPRGLELEEWVQYLENCEEFSVDIETTRKGDIGTKYMLCIGFSPRPDLAICIVNRDNGETSNAIARILASPANKIFHFGTFDFEALRINGYEVKNFTYDTLTAQHILNAELPRGLDFLTSIYTREPYYKSSGRSEIPGDTKEWSGKVDRDALYVYNCRDVCCTIEIWQQQREELKASQRDWEMFEYEMSLIPVGHSMSKNGLLIDTERRSIFEKALFHRWMKLQQLMNTLCGKEVNVRSPNLKNVLYGDFKLPVRRNRNQGVTTDEDAIVSLITYVAGHIANLKRDDAINEWKIKLLVLKTILEIRGIRQLLSNYIKKPISLDGRCRSIYKFSSTETGRAACEQYIDNSGVNAQTFPRSSIEIPEVMTDVPMFDLNDDDDSNSDGE